MKNLLLWGFVPAVLATAQLAQAQLAASPNRALTFSNVEAPVGSGTITYQWYRDGQPISGATGANYTLPADLANGQGVIEFMRGAKSSNCSEEYFSNPILVTFCVTIRGVCWANANLDEFKVFAERPDMYTRFFQWNRTTAWAVTDAVSDWNSTSDESETWTNNPCPAGWRLPTQDEFYQIHYVGSVWASAGTRGNLVAGYIYGPKFASCTLPDNMAGCVFLPAVGVLYSNGILNYHGEYGYYWSSTQKNDSAYGTFFVSTSSGWESAFGKNSGLNIRCVQ